MFLSHSSPNILLSHHLFTLYILISSPIYLKQNYNKITESNGPFCFTSNWHFKLTCEVIILTLAHLMRLHMQLDLLEHFFM